MDVITFLSIYYNSKFSSQLPWQFAVCDKKRALLAIILDKFLEIRHIRDEYQKPIGRTPGKTQIFNYRHSQALLVYTCHFLPCSTNR